MITIKDVQIAPNLEKQDLHLSSTKTIQVNGKDLIALPGLIDPHVHFRTPGLEHKENWITAARSCIMGGYVAAYDMPNTIPPTISYQRVIEKKALIETQLKEAGIPLRYGLYLGADKHHFDEIVKAQHDVVALKIFMGSSTGNLAIDDDSSLHAAFAIAGALDLLVCVHAEDEALIHERLKVQPSTYDYSEHARLRSPDVACRATEKALMLSKLYKTRLHILHLSTKDEIELIRDAKKTNPLVSCETTPHHIFLDDSHYHTVKGHAVVNPPIRSKEHREALLKALQEGLIDTIGSDHAPHTLEEKTKPYPAVPSGMPGVETMLPLLMNAYHKGLISLQRIIDLTYHNIRAIYKTPAHDDITLVDPLLTKTVHGKHLQSKSGWSPYEGMTLTGWPTHVILKGHLYDLKNLSF